MPNLSLPCEPLFVPLLVLVCTLVGGTLAAGSALAQDGWQPDVPRTWDEGALATLELPNAVTGRPPKHVDADFYYSIPATVLYRAYPVYHPDDEPEGYFAALAAAEPEVAFDPAALHSRADWVAAGERVFHWPIQLTPIQREGPRSLRARLLELPLPKDKDGVIPYMRYVVRQRGVVEIGNLSCAACHSRVMPDGSVIQGAQGNLPFDQGNAAGFDGIPRELALAGLNGLFGMPPDERAAPPFSPELSVAEMAAAFAAIPPGVLARHGTSLTSPVQVPDLIGVRDRRYLDRSGLVRHRGIGDLMRYAALNQDLDLLADHAGFVPDMALLASVPEQDAPPGVPTRDELRARILDPKTRFRYSDEQLYALALFLYDLSPPDSPHALDELALRGQAVFDGEGCATCHTPPAYTSNQLVPAPGFEVPEALRATEDIRPRGIGTDPKLTLTTRRGTGFYKVPSLLGVWYRGPFEHNGSVATLEDWFDPARLRDDYVPTGWNPGGGPRAVRGHQFGLELDAEDRAALIAFLRTL